MRFPLISKMGALGAVTLGLLWSLWSVQSVVHERQGRLGEAERSVANSLAGSQSLLGPVLTRRCTESWVTFNEDDKGTRRPVAESETHVLRLPATQLQFDAQVGISPRHRGMFKVNGYGLTSKVQARWSDLSALVLHPSRSNAEVRCDAPVLSVAVSDARGIRVAELQVDGRAVAVHPGSGLKPHPHGFQAPLPELGDAQLVRGSVLSVVVSLELAGTRSLSIAPVADTTLVRLHSDWPHPSFMGRFLPSERAVRKDGFDATWKVTALASSALQEWRKGAGLCLSAAPHDGMPHDLQASWDEAAAQVDADKPACVESFGVSFMDPVNPYTLSDRATKYGLLFIVLTFVGVGLVEVLRRLRVHPIQYLLVGAALSIFFLLLVSLSEHLAFGWAYLGASLACTFLLTFYGSFVLRGWAAGLGFGAGIAALFATLYALLQMEQNALVLGSLMLFAVLATIMVSTRKLDWYELLAQVRQQGATAHDAAP